MINIKILSLATDELRRELIASQLSEFGFPFEFIDAPDGRKNTIPKNKLSKLSNTEAACALGHINIYNRLIDSGDECWVVLEDDAIVNEKEISALGNILNRIEKSEPAIYILGGQEGINAARYFVGKLVVKEERYRILQSYNSSEYVFRTCCYIVTRGAANRIAKGNSELMYAADNWSEFLSNNWIVEPFVVRPSLFFHPKDLRGSHIQQSRNQKNTYLKMLIRPFLVFYRILCYGIRILSCRLFS